MPLIKRESSALAAVPWAMIGPIMPLVFHRTWYGLIEPLVWLRAKLYAKIIADKLAKSKRAEMLTSGGEAGAC
jgi:hypothetical protein